MSEGELKDVMETMTKKRRMVEKWRDRVCRDVQPHGGKVQRILEESPRRHGKSLSLQHSQERFANAAAPRQRLVWA